MTRFSARILVSLFLSVFSLPWFVPPVRGQTNLTLEDAINLSLQNNSRWMLAREKVIENGLKVKEAWGKLWPDLNIDVSRTFMGAEKGINALSSGQANVDFVKGSFSINPGVFYHSLQATRDIYVISVNDERKARADTIVKTIELYNKSFLAAENVTLMSNSLQALQANLQAANASYNSGSGMNVDRLRAGVVVANQRTKLIMAQNDLRNSRAALNAHMGRGWNSPFTIDAASITVNESEVSGYTNMPDATIDSNLDALTLAALKNRPEILQVTFKKKAALDSARANASAYLFPSFFVSGSWGTSKSIAKEGAGPAPTGNPATDAIIKAMVGEFSPSGWNGSWNLTMGATYKFGALAPWDPSHARAGQSLSQARQADLEMDDLVKSIRLEVQQKFFKLISAASVILSQKDNIASSEEYFRVAIIQFKNGVIDNSKLLSADVDLENAKTMYIQALFDFQMAKADLNRAIGGDKFQY